MMLLPDARIQVDGLNGVILELNGQAVVLKIDGVGTQSVRLIDIMFDTSGRYRFPDEPVPDPYAYSHADWTATGDDLDEQFATAHLQFSWVESGILPSDTAPKVAAAFGDYANKTERVKAVASMIGRSERATWDRYEKWRKGDRFGAIGRPRRLNHNPHPSVSPRYLEEAVKYADERHKGGMSKISQRNFHKLLRQRIQKFRSSGEVIPIPSKTVRYEAVGQKLKERGIFTDIIRRQDGNSSRTKTEYGRIDATRPGQYFLVDTTRLDVHALSAFSNKWTHVELTIMMDLYSKVIVASRLSPVTTDGVDIALLFFDMFHPRREAWSYGSGVILPTAGCPNYLLINPSTGEFGYGEDATMAAIRPETLVTDNGKVFISSQVHAIAAANGISVLRGRVMKGSDKGQVERMFRRIREDLLELITGYKGHEPGAHGNSAEINASFLVEELDDMIRQYFADFYHRSDHTGASPFGLPNEPWTPMEKLEEGIARAGIRMTNRSIDMALDLLPVHWVTIQHYGIQIDGLRYDADVLKPWVQIKSSYRAMKGKWPIAVNGSDRQYVYFQDPTTKTWNALRWAGADSFTGPFSTSMLARSIKRQRQQGIEIPRNDRDEEAADALISLVQSWDDAIGIPHEDEQLLLRMSGYKNPFRVLGVVMSSFRDLFQIRSEASPRHRAKVGRQTIAAALTKRAHEAEDRPVADDDFYGDSL